MLSYTKLIIELYEELLICYMRERLHEKNEKKKDKYSKLMKEVCDSLEDMYNELNERKNKNGIIRYNPKGTLCTTR